MGAVSYRLMEGTRRIILKQILPGADGPTGRGPAREGRTVKAWATPSYLGGRESLQEGTIVVHEHKARWRVRQIGLSDLSTAWEMTDDTGRTWDIQAITEPPGQRGVWWDIHAEETK